MGLWPTGRMQQARAAALHAVHAAAERPMIGRRSHASCALPLSGRRRESRGVGARGGGSSGGRARLVAAELLGSHVSVVASKVGARRHLAHVSIGPGHVAVLYCCATQAFGVVGRLAEVVEGGGVSSDVCRQPAVIVAAQELGPALCTCWRCRGLRVAPAAARPAGRCSTCANGQRRPGEALGGVPALAGRLAAWLLAP
jgi:hypothetical protein